MKNRELDTGRYPELEAESRTSDIWHMTAYDQNLEPPTADKQAQVRLLSYVKVERYILQLPASTVRRFPFYTDEFDLHIAINVDPLCNTSLQITALFRVTTHYVHENWIHSLPRRHVRPAQI